MIRLARVVLIAALALWAGGLATISFVVAPAAFRTAPSRQVAGQLVGATLRVFGNIEIACGVLALSASLLLGRRKGVGLVERRLRPFAIALMLGITLTYVGWLYPFMGQGPRPTDPTSAEGFAWLHGLSVVLVGCNILLGTGLLMATAGSRTDGA